MIVVIGTNDTLASPGAQLDYYQSVIDKMGQSGVDQFARFFVIPQAGHGLTRRQLFRSTATAKRYPPFRSQTASTGSAYSSIGLRRRSPLANR